MKEPFTKERTGGMNKRWRCLVCGFIYEGEAPPFECPICGAPRRMFEPVGNCDPQVGTREDLA